MNSTLLLHNAPLRRWLFQRLGFVFPVLCFLASLLYFGETMLFQWQAKATQGEVVRVYVWDNDNPFFGGDKLYGPVFRYVWSDGKPTQASTGQSFSTPFKAGERHAILFDPDRKTDVRLTYFEQLWALPVILLLIALITFLAAWILWAWAIRPRINRPYERKLLSLPGGADKLIDSKE